MRLLKGRTLAALLAGRDAPQMGDLPRFLSIFEAVCQTVAYAHARGVIHRDLKPPNIMVGSYGQVQVIDWGMAKVLPQRGVAKESPDGGDAAVSVIHTVRTGPDTGPSQTGRLGTPAYMPPEQARGEVELIDERADLFGLGSILCELLTGKPVYTGPTGWAIQNAAIRGDTADALRRLESCGADAELIELARDCLKVDSRERPRNAGEIVRRLNAYLAGVQERLRAAELARAAEAARAEEAERTAEAAEQACAAESARAEEAQARAVVERSRRRRTMTLAASLLALTTVGGLSFTYITLQRQIHLAGQQRLLGLATTLLDQARAAPDDPVRWQTALAAVEQVEQDAAGVPPDIRDQVTQLQAAAASGLHDAESTAALLHVPEDATVFLKLKVGRSISSGTGFVIRVERDTALIATNRHVVTPDLDDKEGAKLEVTAVFRSGKGPGQEESLPAEIVAIDSGEEINHDLALVRVRGLKRPVTPIDVNQIASPTLRMRYAAYGFPLPMLKFNQGNPTITVTQGSVSKLRPDQLGQLFAIQLDGSLQPGNSGGPIVDDRGRLIGVAVAKLEGSTRSAWRSRPMSSVSCWPAGSGPST
jgi:S1-C subfamily serine protease